MILRKFRKNQSRKTVMEMEQIFRTDIRCFIPPDEYFAKAEFHRKHSLCNKDLTQIKKSILKKRLADLLEDEEMNGFVFVGERLWILDYLDENSGRSFAKYDDWLFQRFKQDILKTPFDWGTYNDRQNDELTNEENINIWKGKLKNLEFMPDFPEIKPETFYFWESFDISIALL